VAEATASPSKPRKEWAPSVDNTVDKKKVGSNLSDLRTSLNLDEATAAKRSGVSTQRVKKIEAGTGDPANLEELAGLATAYDYTTSGLIRRVSKK
jgi:transcriptional regulator with XRE-family HTH domain